MKLPEMVKPSCTCYLPPDYTGCECGNFDDAHSAGFYQGWNACLEEIIKINQADVG